jgi:hypothetical protein
MISLEIDHEVGIALLIPSGELTENDFEIIAKVIDPYIEERGSLQGLIIHTKEFPGWDSFAALIKHIKFVKNHHEKLSHVAVVTDSGIGNLAEKIAGHFVAAKIRHFPYDDYIDARNWILGV